MPLGTTLSTDLTESYEGRDLGFVKPFYVSYQSLRKAKYVQSPGSEQ